MKFISICTLFFGFSVASIAQTNSLNPITTTVPYLTVSPDARSSALGNAGVALSPDANSIYWNASKLAFIESNSSFSLSYSPWLKNISSDMNLAYASFVHKLDDRNTIGGSLHYFNMGSFELADESANSLGSAQAGEFSFDAALARKFGNNFSLGLTLRFIHSNLGPSLVVEDQQASSVNMMSSDVSMYYKKTVKQFGKDARFAFGASISNIGPKVSYTTSGEKDFLPTNLKIGAANTWLLNSQNELTFLLDLNKLLVPTPPIRNDGKIIEGKDDNRSVVSGMFGSFNDAPNGFKEEFQEISYSPALEYLYNKQFALRAGYSYENPNKGDRRYMTLGAGLRYQIFDLDFSYLIASQDKSALANTLCFSLSFNFAEAKK